MKQIARDIHPNVHGEFVRRITESSELWTVTCYLCDKWYLEELYKYENIGYGHKAVKRLKEILDKNGLKPLAKKIKTSYPSISDPEAKTDDEQST